MTDVLVAVDRPRSDASPVLAEWFVGWSDVLAAVDREALGRYTDRLAGSAGSVEQEVSRQWLAIDWLVRVAAPLWLRGARLVEHAERLGRAPIVLDRRSLVGVAGIAEAASVAARDAHDEAWSAVTHLAEPDPDDTGGRPPWRPAPGSADPRRVATWASLAGGTRAAIPPLGRLLGPACRATGYGPANDEDPSAWRAAAGVVADAAGVVAWNATRTVVTTSGWSWHMPGAEARRLAYGEARAALAPVETAFIASAHDVVERMFRVTERTDGCSVLAGRKGLL